MNCLRCGHSLDTGLKCWGCGIQYRLVEESSTANTWYNSRSDNWPETILYYPGDEYVQWEY